MSEELKVYTHSYHIERQFVKDKSGRLFHYSYDEEMSFDGGDDGEGILWKLITNDANSDDLSRKGGMGVLHEPNVGSAETNLRLSKSKTDSKLSFFTEKVQIFDV